METRDYYPFGLRMPGRSITEGTPVVEDYTGHELDDETGMHYAGARYYMSALGRFGALDPMSHEYPSWSPYHYAANNPLKFADPTGKFWVNRSRVTGDVRAGRLGWWGARVWTDVGSVPGASDLVFVGIRALWTRGNADYSALKPSWRDWVGGVVSAFKQYGTTASPGPMAARRVNKDKMTPLFETSVADKITFKSIANLHKESSGPKVTVAGESFDLIDDTGGGERIFSLGLNDDLKNAWEESGLNSINEFAKELGSYQKAAKNIVNTYASEEKQMSMMRK